MKKTKHNLRFLAAGTAVLGASLAGLTTASAWGPERTTFTMESPATYPTFNSITNNPTIGDERDFVRVGEIDAEVTDLGNTVEVVPGRQYLVYIYFHNNASSTYNDSAHNNSGVAWKTRLASSFSTVLTPEEKGSITATITAENSDPLSVWDEAYMTTSSEKVLLHYVAGSAKIYNDWKANGSVLSTSLFTEEGTLLGLNALNGVIPGCEEYHGIVTYVLQAEALDGSIEKTVSKDGTAFGESVSVKAGDEVSFRLTIRNTGDIALTNAVIKDTLPKGLDLVPGSVSLRANNSEVSDTLSDNILGTGYNLGTIGTGNIIYITYRATASEDFDCTGAELTNSASLTYDSEVSTGDTRSDSASVIVKANDCTEPEPNIPEVIEDIVDPKPTPTPEPEKNCKTNPEMEGCQVLPNTGPLQITLAVVVVLCIAGAGFYFYRTRKTLKHVKDNISGDGGDNNNQPGSDTTGTTPETPSV